MKNKEQFNSSEYVLVNAPNRAGKEFIHLLRSKGIKYYALTNNKYGKKKLEAMGVDSIIMVDTEDAATWVLPDIQISKVYLFEISFNLCSRYIQICKEWGSESIHVVTKGDKSRSAYRGLGANRYTYINTNNEVASLLP